MCDSTEVDHLGKLDNNRCLINVASGQSAEWPPALFSFPVGDSAELYQECLCLLVSPHVRLIHVACLDAAVLKNTLVNLSILLLFYVFYQPD